MRVADSRGAENYSDRPLRAGFDDGRGELMEVIEVFDDDRVHDVEIQAGVFVNGDITEADHALHACGQIGGKQACGL